MNIKTEDFYKDIANDVEKRFDTSNYEVDRPLPTGKKLKSHWINERLITRKVYYRICCFKTKNLFILNR